jgi:hypothetical protein
VNTPMAGSMAFMISVPLAICLIGFLLLSLAITLRKRRLTIWELMIYVAGAAVTMAIPCCFRERSDRYADVTILYWEVAWFSLGLCYLFLAPIMLLIYRKSRQ